MSLVGNWMFGVDCTFEFYHVSWSFWYTNHYPSPSSNEHMICWRSLMAGGHFHLVRGTFAAEFNIYTPFIAWRLISSKKVKGNQIGRPDIYLLLAPNYLLRLILWWPATFSLPARAYRHYLNNISNVPWFKQILLMCSSRVRKWCGTAWNDSKAGRDSRQERGASEQMVPARNKLF